MSAGRLRHRLVKSNHPAVTLAKRTARQIRATSFPLPRVVSVVLLAAFVGVRTVFHWCRRVFYAELLFRGYLTSCGARFHTGIFLHWVMGRGQIIVGDDVTIDGKCSFAFAARYSEAPTLRIGSRTGIGHDCSFTVGRLIQIGDDCRLANSIIMFDASGHATESELRRRGAPAPDQSVKPITIENNVWIGNRAIIFPGVTIGENSIVAAGAVVTASVSPNSFMVGNPARRVADIPSGIESQAAATAAATPST